MRADAIPPRRPPWVAADPPAYAAWAIAAEPRPDDLDQQRAAAIAGGTGPLVSVLVPVHRVPLGFLAAALDSLEAQTCPSWEACIAHAPGADEEVARFLVDRQRADPRIMPVCLESNDGISAATNAALAAARGEFIALLDQDDTLSPEALWRMQEAIRDCPEADLLYSDKDCLDADGRTRRRPLFKPEWSPEMLYSVNYLTHFNLLRRVLVVDAGGFRPHTDGAQDWDIFFRVAEKSRRVIRVPGVHYHWRLHEASTSLAGTSAKPYVPAAQQVAIQEHLDRLHLPARVEPSPESGFQIHWRLPDETPVHVVLDGVDQAAGEIGPLARSILAELAALPASGHVPPARRLTVLAHGERCEAVVAACGVAPAGIDVGVVGTAPADVARVTKTAVGHHAAAGGALVFVAGRVAVGRDGWLAGLVGWAACHPEIGFATGLVVGADGNVVECGLVVDAQGRGTPLFRDVPPWQWGWFGGPMWYRNVSAASPWAVAVKADAWAEVDGFGPGQPPADPFLALCRRLRCVGYRGVVEPHSRITLGPGPLAAVPPFDPSVGDDPCFHPAFSRVVPLELGHGPAAAAARRPRALRRLPPALVVAGMHRSGTSLVASLVAGAGVSLGTRLLDAGRGNARGHFEDLDFQQLHQKALRASGFHGDGILPDGQPRFPAGLAGTARDLVAARRAAGAPWGWKDPRTLLFLDFWAEQVPEASWLFVFRSPWETADSLYRRLDEPCVSDPLLALRAWTHANRFLLDFVRRHPGRCLVRELGQIVADPAGTFAEIRDRFGVPLGVPPSCYEPTLLGGDPDARAEQAALIRALCPDAFGLYHDLRRLAESDAALPEPLGGTTGDPLQATPVAAMSAWARGSRQRSLAAADLKRATAAAEAEAERRIADTRQECATWVTAAQAEIDRQRHEIDRQHGEIVALRAEIYRMHLRLEEAALAAAVPVAAPKLRTADKVLREAVRLARHMHGVAGHVAVRRRHKARA